MRVERSATCCSRAGNVPRALFGVEGGEKDFLICCTNGSVVCFTLQETAESQGISAMPTFIFYRNGKKVQSHSQTLGRKVESLGMRLK